MAGSLKTAFFNLAKYAANDITSWLTDFNGNMDKIDAAMNQNKTAAQTARDAVDNLESEYETLLTVVNGHTTSINANEKAIAANNASIAALESDISEISIGELFSFTESSNLVTKIETLASSLALQLQKLGKYALLSCVMILNAGTCHTYDRVGTGVLEGQYITDIYRINGNPAGLFPNVWTLSSAIAANSDNSGTLGNSRIAVCYVSAINATVVGIVAASSTPLEVSKTLFIFN